MAVIDGYIFPSVSYRREIQYDEAPNVDSVPYVALTPPIPDISKLASVPSFSQITDNLPVEVEPLESHSGWRQPSFLDDYYYRVHIKPGIIALGNLLSNQTRQIEVWSAYFEPQLLSSIQESNTDGLTLYQPTNPPTYFAALESRLYTLSISTSGSPVVDAAYLFNFNFETPKLSVTGRRVVVLPDKPKYPLKEALEWKTDIIKSYAGEQRIRLRDSPRQIFSLEAVITDASYTKLKAISYQWAHRVFAVPVWTDAVLLSTVASGSTILTFNTSNKDFRSFDIIIIWKSETNFEAIETLNVYSDHVELKLPVVSSYTNALVIPARFANSLSGISFSRDADATIKLSGNFTVRMNKNLESISWLQKYKNLPVLLDKPLSSESLSDLYIRDTDMFDNGSSAVELDTKSSIVEITSKVSFMTFDKAKAFQYRQFVHYLHGRQKTFFMPSWHDEFEVIRDFSSASTSITIKNIGFTLYYDNRFVYIESVTGQKAFCKVLSSSVTNDGDELLNLDAAVGFNATVAQVKLCCLLKYVRLNADTVQIKHDVADEFRFDLQVIEVPYEL